MIMEKSDSVSLQELWYNSALMSHSLDILAIHRSRRVMVAVKMMNATGRQRLRGVYRYLAEGHDWDLQLVRAETELTRWDSRISRLLPSIARNAGRTRRCTCSGRVVLDESDPRTEGLFPFAG